MSSKIKKFLFSFVFLLIVFNFWKAMNPSIEDEPIIEAKQVEKTPKLIAVKPDLEATTEEVTPVVKVAVDKTYENYIKKELPLAQDRDIKCSRAADEIFKDPAFIDVEDPFYKNPINVLERLHGVYSQTLLRTEVVTAYTSLSVILQNNLYEGTKLTPQEYRNQVGLLEYYCRPEMSLRFVETVMEANKRYKFSPRMKKDIFDMSISMLESVISEMFTTNNLIYGLGFFKLLIDNNMIPKEVSEEIVPLFDKVLEHHKGFTNTWRREKESSDKNGLWTLLKEDHVRREELGLEFKEFIGQMRSRYYSGN